MSKQPISPSRQPADYAVSWFHGLVTRDASEHILTINGKNEGQFLVRESTTSSGDYVLSVFHDNDFIHYQIRRRGEDAFFSIDDGPVLHGIESLVVYYQEGERGLLSKLGPFCPGQPPPPEIRCHGRSNLLHRATAGGDSVVVGELLKSGYHSLDAKNQDGQTAVHLATNNNNTEILKMLLDSGASANIKDSKGLTPLHEAAGLGAYEACKILLHYGKANPQLRASETGWVPLHEASFKGHAKVVEVLLDYGAPSHPRSYENFTAADLARKEGQLECVNLIENFEPPNPRMNQTCWLHKVMPRETAASLLRHYGLTDGLFLVRNSSRNAENHVLSMAQSSHIFHFEIHKKGEFFFIDDGPYFPSLELMVDYYSRLADGLPTRLVKPVLPKQFSGSSSTLLSTTERRNKKTSHNESQLEIYLGPNLIPKESLFIGDAIGFGEYGSVMKGTCLGPGKSKIDVAIKMLHNERISKSRDEFIREVEVMVALRHPSIVHLVGVCLGPPLMMVTELVPMGCLLDYLLDAKLNNAEDVDDWNKHLRLWAGQIAGGMTYLELKRFVHRDLAARNILLASKEQVKISDFGLSRVLGAESDYYKATSGGRWPVKWYAPESVNFGNFSHASDVWSYGVTLWEMFTFGGQPYGDLMGQEVMELIEDGQRLPKPYRIDFVGENGDTYNCPDDVNDVMNKCWSYSPDKRPTFSQLHQHFVGCNDFICNLNEPIIPL